MISQKVSGYTDPNIYFAWKAVLKNGGHSEDESAEMLITLTDDTTNTLLVSRVYSAGKAVSMRASRNPARSSTPPAGR